MEDRRRWMERTIALAVENVKRNEGGPFAALVVRRGELIASGANSVTRLKDPTAHAEIMAIRTACQTLGTFELKDCEIYCSCEPCPMCLGAMYWARPQAFYYSAVRGDAATAASTTT